MAENATERVLRYLVDLHAAEAGGLESLKDVAKQAADPQLKSLLEQHIPQTQTQIERLQTRIGALGGHDSGGKNVLNSVIAKGSNLLNAFHDTEDKQTQDLIKLYSFKYFEMGSYIALEAYAAAVGDSETASLARSIRGEEQQTADALNKLIPQVSTSALKTTYGEGAPA